MSMTAREAILDELNEISKADVEDELTDARERKEEHLQFLRLELIRYLQDIQELQDKLTTLRLEMGLLLDGKLTTPFGEYRVACPARYEEDLMSDLDWVDEQLYYAIDMAKHYHAQLVHLN